MNHRKAIRPIGDGWLFACLAALLGLASQVVGCAGFNRSRAQDAAASASTAGGQAVAASIPLQRQWRSGCLALDVELLADTPLRGERGHGRGRGRNVSLVVDSGAEISGLLENHADGLVVLDERIPVRALHGGRLDGAVVGADLRLGNGESGSIVGDGEFVVFPATARLPGGTDGLLGIDFLSSTRMALDVGEARLRAAPIAPLPADQWIGLEMLRSGNSGGPLRFAVCRVSGRELVWLIDSGASQTLLSQRTARQLELKVSRRNTQMVDGGGQRVALGHARLNETGWGGRRLSGMSVGVAPMKDLQMLSTATGAPVDGVLGLDMLRRCQAVIDVPGNRLWLRLSAKQH